MDGASTHGIDAFSALLVDLHEVHKREVGALKAEISFLRSTSADVKQMDSCNRDAPTAAANQSSLELPFQSLNLGSGPMRQREPSAEPEYFATRSPYVSGRSSDGKSVDSAYISPTDTSPDPSPMGKSAQPESAPDSPTVQSVAATFDSTGSPTSRYSALKGVMRGSSRVVERLMSSSDRAPSGLSAIRKRPSQVAKIDFSSVRDFLSSLVKHGRFETFLCVLIFLNSCLIAVEVQLSGWTIREALWNPSVDAPRDHTIAHQVLATLSWIFGIMFTLEIVAKILGLRSRFGADYWNWIDLSVCVAWLASKLACDYMPFNAQLLRLFRLARLLRLLRLVRAIQGFDSLFIMTTAIKGSLSVFVWTCLLLSLVQMVFALLLNQYLQDQYFDLGLGLDSESRRKQQEVFMYFGTFTRALFTTFEMTLANWPPACRVLAENVSEWFFVFAVIYKLSMGFAVVGVINGVFIQETFKVISMDDSIMMRQNARVGQAHKEKMTQLFQEVGGVNDGSLGDGLVSREAWVEIINDEQVKLWLASMELVTPDAEKLFDLLAETQDGYMSLEQLTRGVARLRGSARSIDLHVLLQEQQEIRSLLESNLLAARHGNSFYTEQPSVSYVLTNEISKEISIRPVKQAVDQALQPVDKEQHPKHKDMAASDDGHMSPGDPRDEGRCRPSSSPTFGPMVLGI